MTTIDDQAEWGKKDRAEIRPDRIRFRHECATDTSVIRHAHAGHWRAPPGVDLPSALLAQLLDQQHRLQEHHIATAHPDADRRMILCDGMAVGRICLVRDARHRQVVDLALVAEAQGRGIARIVLNYLMDEATPARAAILLDVARDNVRAQALYRRAGFGPVGKDSCTHFRWIWHPPSADYLPHLRSDATHPTMADRGNR